MSETQKPLDAATQVGLLAAKQAKEKIAELERHHNDMLALVEQPEREMNKLQKIIDEECQNEIKNARANIRKYIQSATLSLIGLEKKHWGGGSLEIDHCNGRNSVLIDAFRRIAAEEAEKIAAEYKPSKDDLVAYRKAFREEFDRNIRQSLREAARHRAKQEAESLVDKIKISTDKYLGLIE